MQETRVRSLSWEDPQQKEMATHSSIHTWRIPWTEETGGLQSIGSQKVGHDWGDLACAHAHTHTHTHTHPCFYYCYLMWRVDTLEKTCGERLNAGGEGDYKGWNGWIASLIQWTCVWASSRKWWRTGKPDLLQSMGLQRIRHNGAT